MIDTAENMGLKPFRYYMDGDELKIEERERDDGKNLRERVGTYLYFNTRVYFLLAEAKRKVIQMVGSSQQDQEWFLQFIPRVDSMWEPGPNSEYMKNAWNFYGEIVGAWDKECRANGSLFYVFSESYEPGSLEFNLSWGFLKKEEGTVYARDDQGEWAEVDYYKPRNSR